MNADIHTSVTQMLSELSNPKFRKFVNSQYFFYRDSNECQGQDLKIPHSPNQSSKTITTALDEGKSLRRKSQWMVFIHLFIKQPKSIS